MLSGTLMEGFMKNVKSISKKSHQLRVSCIGLRAQIEDLRLTSSRKSSYLEQLPKLEKQLTDLKKEYLELELNERLDQYHNS